MPQTNPKGRKPLPWKRDPLILERLVKVESLHLMGVTNIGIGSQLNVTEATVRNDLKRLAIIWKERVGDDIAEQKERAVAVYRKVQSEAWRAFHGAPDKSLNRSAYLNTVKNSEDSIVKVLGLNEPEKLAIRQEGPVVIEVEYIDKPIIPEG